MMMIMCVAPFLQEMQSKVLCNKVMTSSDTCSKLKASLDTSVTVELQSLAQPYVWNDSLNPGEDNLSFINS